MHAQPTAGRGGPPRDTGAALRTILSLILLVPATHGAWPRHTLDASSRGADGLRLADANGDGRMDIATPWEEGGLVKVYFHPGPRRCRKPWPSVTVGRVASPEDALLADVDRDGSLDVVSCTEGRRRTIFVHWGPPAAVYREARHWQTEAIPVTAGVQSWMYAAPLPNSAQSAVDLVVGSKGPAAAIHLLCPGSEPRQVETWTLHPLRPAGWIMSLEPLPVGPSGHAEILFTDRKGNRSGVGRLVCLEADRRRPWSEARLDLPGRPVMFLAVGDLDQDGRMDAVVDSHDRRLYVLRGGEPTKPVAIASPHGIVRGKGVAIGDINGDQRPDLVTTAEQDAHPLSVSWLEYHGTLAQARWTVHDIGGPEGQKFDLVHLLDVDEDGDLDVLTCEEVDQLGVIWYENPRIGGVPQRVDGIR